MTEIIALDISSTTIGGCLLRDGEPVETWSWTLKGTLYERCQRAYEDGIRACDKRYDSHTVLAIEAPAYSRHEHVAIQRVTGAVLAGWLGRQRDTRIMEIAPNTAKKALTNDGKADKTTMIYFARQYLATVQNDHEADAMAVGFGAIGTLRQGGDV